MSIARNRREDMDCILDDIEMLAGVLYFRAASDELPLKIEDCFIATIHRLKERAEDARLVFETLDREFITPDEGSPRTTAWAEVKQ